ncbi:MAG TPA: twin-arginine translocase subunit TatC [Thermomicrobiales bacterium]|nr:twin-arginine translocase subunit TatC [Thermomicrobiales bacterium]
MASIINRVASPIRGRRSGSGQAQPPPSDEPMSPEIDEDVFIEMTLADHLEELRSRLLKSAVAVMICLVGGIWLSWKVLDAIAASANVTNDQMQVISPTENFVVWMKLILYIAIALAMPVLIYQLMSFLVPGLTRRERRYVLRAVPFVFLMFCAGAAFAFFVLAPRALDFLSTFGMDYFRWDPHASEIIQFYLTLMLGMGLIFELPVVMYALALIGVMNAKRYGRFRKFALILGMVAAAIITPTPDPFNMMMVAIPTYALYEVGILLSRTVRNPLRSQE